MNKVNLLKKTFLGFVALFGVLTLASCASANKSDARILVKDSTCTIIDQKIDGKEQKILRVTLVIDNQTIYNINAVDIKYNYELIDGTKGETETFHFGQGTDMYAMGVIRYGISGVVAGDILLDTTVEPKYAELKSVSFNEEATKVIGFQNLWDTYMGWFIAAIIIFALSFGGFLFAIFNQHINRNNIKDFLNEHITTTLITAFFALVICIIPLIFSSWVVTLILFGSFLANILLSLLVTMLRVNHLEKKKID